VSLDELEREYDAVLLAVGAQRSQRLGIPGESELHGVIPATTFLKEFNLDPETKMQGGVAVVGGGSTAMDAARSALRAGADKVHILYRRSRVEMPAQAEEVRAALAEGIELHELVTPVQILSAPIRPANAAHSRLVLRTQAEREATPLDRGYASRQAACKEKEG
jgi:formate dehydrogenase beta subunit